MDLRPTRAWIISGLLIAGVTTVTPATAQQPDEMLYLQKVEQIDVRAGRQVIDLRKAKGAVRGLRVRARSGVIRLSNVRVTYSDGTTFNERRLIVLRAGERTRVIDPRGKDKFVERIELFFDPAASRSQPPVIQVIAHQTRRGREMRRPARQQRQAPPQPQATAALARPQAPARAPEPAQPTSEPRRVRVPLPQSRPSPPAPKVTVTASASPQVLPRAATPPPLPARPARIAAPKPELARPAALAPAPPRPEKRPAAPTLTAKTSPAGKTPPLPLRTQRAPVQTAATDAASTTLQTASTDANVQPPNAPPSTEANATEDEPPQVSLPVQKSAILNALADEDAGIVLMAAQRIGLGLDRDVLIAGKALGEFARLRLRVLENDVFLETIQIIFQNGQSRIVPIGTVVAKGGQTGWVALERPRFIKEVRLTYQARTDIRARARIELLGERGDDWLGPDGRGRRHNDGWVLLGAYSAGFLGIDDDLVMVGPSRGRLSEIRISVRDRAITLNDLRIKFADGTSEVVPIRMRVPASGTWGPFSLKTRTKPIRALQPRYRSQFFDADAADKGAAIVQIWARY